MKTIKTWTLACSMAGMMVFLPVFCSGQEQGDPDQMSRIEAWESAAMNRELAAASQIQQRETRLKEARVLLMGEYKNTQGRIQNLIRAGDLYMAASGLAAAAIGNFSQAAANWDRLVQEYRKIGDKKLEAEAAELARVARRNANEGVEKAGTDCERAAEVYAMDEGIDPSRSAGANEKAAGWREKLASVR